MTFWTSVSAIPTSCTRNFVKVRVIQESPWNFDSVQPGVLLDNILTGKDIVPSIWIPEKEETYQHQQRLLNTRCWNLPAVKDVSNVQRVKLKAEQTMFVQFAMFTYVMQVQKIVFRFPQLIKIYMCVCKKHFKIFSLLPLTHIGTNMSQILNTSYKDRINCSPVKRSLLVFFKHILSNKVLYKKHFFKITILICFKVLYSWFYMSSSIHKILVDDGKVVESDILPIEMFSEEVQEARNKHVRKFWESHSESFSKKQLFRTCLIIFLLGLLQTLFFLT